MTGLEKIIKAIEADAQASIDGIFAEAKEEAEEILSLAKEEAEQDKVKIAEKPAFEVKAILSRAESSAKLLKRQMILDAKQQVINDVITKARYKLTSLSDTDYFDIILQIVKKHAHPQAGMIMFSQADIDRMPKKFDKSIDTAIKGIQNASLTISKENAAKLDGGFILVYGDIEENCSFEALFNDAREELQDKVNAFLFE
ncbi:MAG: V-type ATP synthase subunit E [Herbinix sp.]|nr:V-type ATP synthase subunit E [Herbinix sp.]